MFYNVFLPLFKGVVSVDSLVFPSLYLCSLRSKEKQKLTNRCESFGNPCESETMTRMKIWYYTTVRADGSEEDIFKSFPEEIHYEAKKGNIRLVKDSIETIGDDTIEYGEGGD
jgi:hypothetical protein